MPCFLRGLSIFGGSGYLLLMQKVVRLDLYKIIYSSRPFGYDDAMLAGILLDARRCNTRDDVTGALICRSDAYLQFLEGPQKAVQATLDRIIADDRHTDVIVHVSERTPTRLFGDWAMLHDPALSWLLPGKAQGPGDLGRIRRSNVHRVFEALAREKAA